MFIIKQYLKDRINTIKCEVNSIKENDTYLMNKLIKKKIEYISYYIDNSINELEELNMILNNDLIKNEDYIKNELEFYENMENFINNYGNIQTL